MPSLVLLVSSISRATARLRERHSINLFCNTVTNKSAAHNQDRSAAERSRVKLFPLHDGDRLLQESVAKIGKPFDARGE